MNFIHKHFKGEYPLGVTFGVIFLGFTAVYHFLEPFVSKPFVDTPAIYIGVSIAYLVVTRLIIYPWQVAGLLRAIEKFHARHDNSFMFYSVQIIVVISLAWTIFHIISVAQVLISYKEGLDFQSAAGKKSYTLSLAANGTLLHLDGAIDFGVTEKVAAALAANPGVTGIVLDSGGGQIYEGRGLAILINRNGLDTYTHRGCSSSCVTAFVGGTKRFLGTGAKLGFHQYAVDAARARQTSPTYDPKAEQMKDLHLFRSRGIDDGFLDKVFRSREMWFPDTRELTEAGLIDGVVEPIDLGDAVVLFTKVNRQERIHRYPK